MKAKTRGIRNNNPGNIRLSKDKWQGLAEKQNDKEFFVFAEPVWGIRALARVLIRYQDKYRIKTVKGIINRWAPPSENDTSSYVASVAANMGVEPNDPIDTHDYVFMKPLVEAIILHENGSQPYTKAQIDRGLALVGVVPLQKPLKSSTTVAAGGVATTATASLGVTESIQQATDFLQPYSAYIQWAQYALIGLTLLSVGYMLYRKWDNSRKLAV